MPTKNTFGVPVVVLSTIKDIEIHMVDQVSVQRDSLVTKNPTETGLNVSDHIVNLPTVISISGRFVDSPFNGILGPAATFASSLADGLADGLSVQKWKELEDLRNSKILSTVVIQQGVFVNMAIRSLRSPRTKGDGTSLRFEIEMVELFLSTLTNDPSSVLDDVAHTADPTAGLGSLSGNVWTGGAPT